MTDDLQSNDSFDYVRVRMVGRQGAVVLLAGTIALELPAAWLRLKLTQFFLHDAVYHILYNIAFLTTVGIYVIAGFGIVRALAALVNPSGNSWWWRNREGGRQPSGPERVSFNDALDDLKAQDPKVRGPKHWFVVDNPDLEAAVCGDTLLLTRGMLDSDFLKPVLAHELGHLNTIDAKLTAALNRLIIKEPRRDPEREKEFPPGLPRLAWRGAMWILRGGLGLRVLAPPWGMWWRQREYEADQYAKHLGQGEELAGYMETNALFYDRPVPFLWLTEHTHPPTELRIDRLRETTWQPRPASESSKDRSQPDGSNPGLPGSPAR